MKNKVMNGSRLVCLLVFCLLAGQVWAGRLQYSKYLKGTAITAGAGLTLSDDFWPEIATGFGPDLFRDKSVRNYIKLHYTGQDNKIYACNSSFSVRVKYSYMGYDKNGDPHPSSGLTSGSVTINVNYGNNTSTELDLSEITAGDGLHFVKVNIIGVTLTGVSTIPGDLFFETGIEVDRYFILDETSPVVPELTAIYTSKNQLNLHWPFIRGAEEYDLEWFFVDEKTEDFDVLEIDDLDAAAFNRVTLPQNTFVLNMVYDKGKVFFRVRGVGKFGDRFEDVIEGVWSNDPGNDEYEVVQDYVMTGISSIATGGEDFLVKNWTYQQSFAEGGKQKEVVSFFDGSGRNRQSVTLTNTYNVSVIGETYYDFEGRPVIATLPTPAGGYSGVMRYFQGLAINNASSRILIQPEYDVSEEGECDPVGLELATSKGSSRYYSPSNTIQTAFQQYLPDAFLYPYSRTAFDSEGRVRSQAGPGKSFALGGDHTVNYFYATPSQEALNRMLGSQAGYASHYILEAVEDANGQIAMTYKDMTGKVVATCLTGDAPTSMEALQSNTGATDFTQSLMSTYESVPEPAYITNQTIFLPAAGDYDFVYTVQLEDYAGLCGDSTGKCKYDLVMSVYNACNDTVEESLGEHDGSSTDVLYTSEPFSFSYYDSPVDGHTETFTFTITVDKPGTYVVSKKLTLNEEHFETAVAAYTQYLQEHLPEACIDGINLPEPPCGMTCEEYCAQPGVECPENYCETYYNASANHCDEMLEVINADMLPGGQYFEGHSGTGEWFINNVENVLNPVFATACPGFVNCTIGAETLTEIFWCYMNTENATLLSAHGNPVLSEWSDIDALLSANSDIDASELLIPTTVSGCTVTGSTPWIEFHPEYCQYERCVTLNTPIVSAGNKSSMQFDKEILLTSYDDAIIKGWITASGPCTTVVYTGMTGADPLDDQSSAAAASPIFSSFVSGYTFPVSSSGNMWTEASTICGTCTCEEIWAVFKGVYNSTKQDYIETEWPADGCVALCDLTVPADQIADNCGGSTLAEGYHINFPIPSGELYDDATMSTTDPEMDDVVAAAEDFNIGCMNYIDINFCDMIEGMCESCTSWNEGNATNYPASLCNPDCDPNHFLLESVGFYVGGNEVFSPLMFGALEDFGIDCDPDPTIDYPAFINAFILMLNSTSSSPEWSAMQLDDCRVRVYNHSSTSYDGQLVQLGRGTDAGSYYRPQTNECMYNIGVIDYQCTPTEMQDCACHWLQLDYNALLEANPGSTAEQIYAMMAEAYSDDANFPGITVIADSVEAWMVNCAEYDVPCTSPDGSTCMPAALLADCNVQPADCEEEQAAVANYYENLDVQEKIDSLVNLFRQHYIDECFGGNFGETFTYEGANHEYHYTLYQYDQAGNLTGTVPPKGVQLVPSTLFAQINENRNDPGNENYAFVDPRHQQKSMYRYNSYGLVTEENVPDKQDILEGEINTQPELGNYLQIQMMNTTDGYAIHDNGAGTYVIKSTTNGGGSWATVSGFTMPGIATVLNAIHFFTNDNVIAFTNDGVYTSINKGVSWGSSVSATLHKGYALDGLDKLYAYTAAGVIEKITLTNPLNGSFGASATSVIGSGFTTNLNSIVYNRANDYIIVANNNATNNLHIVYNLTGMASVSTKTVSGIDIYALNVFEPGVLLTGGDNSGDAAVYWMNLIPDAIPDIGAVYAANISATGSIVKAFAYSEGIIYATGTADLFQASSDYGLTWTIPYHTGTAPTGIDYGSISITPGSNRVVLGGNGNTPILEENDATDQKYFYDQLGRVKASQNTKQYNQSHFAYSYSVYDAEGRVTEAGEAQGVSSDLLAPDATDMNDYANWPGNWLTSVSTTRKEVTKTTYDASIGDNDVDDMFLEGEQVYLRKRVSTVTFDENYTDLDATDYTYAAHYSYDVHGNVNEFVREYKPLASYDQRFKKMEYIYDLVSGNTNGMKYQNGQVDYFEHRYEYDADNRLVYTSTTRDGLTWDNDAKQSYYVHGPLARRETGQHKVQNMDYAYTIGGWLKGVNGAALDEQKEMGQDGKVTNLSTTPYYADYTDIHQWTGRDAFGYAIGYFGDGSNANLRDYESITAGASSGNRWLCDVPQTFGDNLYNGNIRHVVLGLRDQTEDTIRNRATAYKHDQLQRLKETYNYFNWDNSYASILSSTKTGLREKVWYDANGNITALNRYDDAGSPALMDEFSYQYNGNTNRLNHVLDNVSTGGISTDKETQSANNYTYDEIGQLIADNNDNITSIAWNVRNKPTEIEKTGNVKILFEYDELGHRVKKEVRDGTENLWTQQWYVLDPSGNPVAVYEHKYTNPSTNTYNEYLDLKEHQIYGGERLGTRNHENYHLWGQTFTNTSFTVDGEFNHPTGHTAINFPAGSYDLHDRKTGTKTYEIKGHTNNVMVVVTDFKKPYAACTTGVANVVHYLPDVVSYTDYFVFGGTMNNRNLTSNEYRYGFQGQERDNEIKGNDNSVNYEYRMHDPQYGRFLSIDPLAAEYPYNSPYAFAENRLIDGIELEGAEWRPIKNHRGDIVDYSWQGYTEDEDGNVIPKPGTVSGGVITKGTSTYTFSSEMLQVGVVSSSVGRINVKGQSVLTEGGPVRTYEKDYFIDGGDNTYRLLQVPGLLMSVKWPVAFEPTGGEFSIAGVTPPMEFGSTLLWEPKASGLCEPMFCEDMLITGWGLLRGLGHFGNYVNIVKSEGGVFEFYSNFKLHGKTISGITNYEMRDNGVLFLDKLHISGLSPKNGERAGLYYLNLMGKDIGKQFNAKEVLIQGGRRTTGKFKNQIPKPYIIKTK